MTTPIARSTRLPSDLAPNRLATAVAAARPSGRALLRLTEGKPTRPAPP